MVMVLLLLFRSLVEDLILVFIAVTGVVFLISSDTSVALI
jgi:hypothetical protein